VNAVQIELKIEGVGLQGQGVAHDPQGNIYFIPGALPGDTILADYEETTKKYRDAHLVSVTKPSEQRVEPVCAVFDECGGCDWLNWEYSAQVTAKEKTLRHVLERSEWLPDRFLPSIEAKQSLGYRNRIQLRSDGKNLGFYRKGTHDIVDIQSCPVTDPRLNASLASLRENRPEGVGTHKIELALQPDGSVIALQNQRHAAAGFSQIHEQQNILLRAMVAEQVERKQSKCVLELYIGNGNLTEGYADRVEEIFGVDLSAVALAQARQKWAGKTTPRTAFVEAQIHSRLARSLPRDFLKRYDTLLLDPPRAGAEGCLEPLLQENLQTVLYVSCSPVAFTKDVQCLKGSFRFEQVQIIDMFPHTRHIEFVALFSRLPS